MTYLLFQSVIASCVFVHISVLINVKQHMWCYDANKKRWAVAMFLVCAFMYMAVDAMNERGLLG